MAPENEKLAAGVERKVEMGQMGLL